MDNNEKNLFDKLLETNSYSDKSIDNKKDLLEDITFEDALFELDNIVHDLQQSNLALDKSMLLFRRGTKLVELCKNKLDSAEQEVKELLKNGEEVDYQIPNK